MADRIGELAPFAAGHGVRLVLEPLHPIFAADRAVISTLGQALDIAEPFPADVVGVVVDTYHVWWDPDLQRQIARAGAAGRIASYQVCDWILPLAADALLSRGHVGDGYVDFPTITRWVAESRLHRRRRGGDLQRVRLGRPGRRDDRHARRALPGARAAVPLTGGDATASVSATTRCRGAD